MIGPQYIADRGTGDAQFRAIADVLRVPDLGAHLGAQVRSGMTPAAP